MPNSSSKYFETAAKLLRAVMKIRGISEKNYKEFSQTVASETNIGMHVILRFFVGECKIPRKDTRCELIYFAKKYLRPRTVDKYSKLLNVDPDEIF